MILFKSFQYRGTAQDMGLVLAKYEADSQTFVKGDLVVLSGTTDRIALATAGGANQIYGVALDNATNVTSGHKLIPVQVIRPNDLFDCHFASGTTYAATVPGEIHEIVRTRAGHWEVAAGTTAADYRFKVMGTHETTPTSGGPIFGTFISVDNAGAGDVVLQYGTNTAF